MTTITVHTDGACKGKTKLGAWAFVIEDETKSLRRANRVPNTTNQKMELTAAVKALQALKKQVGRPIILYSDSEYVVKGINEWIAGWKAKGWRNANKKPVSNIELWKELDELNAGLTVSWHWVKGHSGNAGNELADTLANRAINEGSVNERKTLSDLT